MLRVRLNIPPLVPVIEAAAEGLVLVNVAMFALADDEGVDAPALYESGAVYRRERRGGEHWQTAAEVATSADHAADCEDLAAYRAAELRFYEGEEGARVKIITTDRGTFHAVVERENGTIEDPSRVCHALERRRG